MLPLLSPSILPLHPDLVQTLEKSASAFKTLCCPGYDENVFIYGSLLTWYTQVSNLFSDGRGPQIYKNWTSNGGDNWGGCYKKWQEHSFVIDNASEAITANRSSRLDKSDLIQKIKRLENTYKKCARLLGNALNVSYSVFLLHAHK